VIALGVMAKNPNVRKMTLVSVAMKLECFDCRTGPDEVYLTAAISGSMEES
jgi:hypothetical protein